MAVTCERCGTFKAAKVLLRINGGALCHYCYHDQTHHHPDHECGCDRDMILPFELRCAVEDATSIYNAAIQGVETDSDCVDPVMSRRGSVDREFLGIKPISDSSRSRIVETLRD